ncbi:MAG: hypothetical protein Homavirus2_13 [Homavirus sp.]|uniref:Uncharacterized protein n=1 Tax=Homavirus sp. TaxID=2487769 RepID=A0A3G5A9I1_9VIRU|nr:MAG: hypothetical protein Homavirus2_13 [Homavirus sp.]
MAKSNEQSKSTKYVDYLNEDEPIPSQNYVCISFLSPEKIRNTSLRGLKIRGVFRTREEADEHCKELQAVDPDFDVFVGEVGKWLPWNPDPNDAKDQIYQEKELNDLMKGYKDNLDKTKRMQQQRKNDMIRSGAEQEQKQNATVSTNSARDRLKKKLEAKQKLKQLNEPKQITNKTSNELETVDVELKEKETLVKEERDRINTVQQVLNEKEQELESIDDKLAKIQQLYSKMSIA